MRFADSFLLLSLAQAGCEIPTGDEYFGCLSNCDPPCPDSSKECDCLKCAAFCLKQMDCTNITFLRVCDEYKQYDEPSCDVECGAASALTVMVAVAVLVARP
mmetsp:Transcript_10775/g.26655  ORF Transcript_10775/g.26655 Transcript_10775/m.26655 type:complete len:102 (+) Transcript_10775:1-306(+)